MKKANAFHATHQHTVAKPVQCRGVGLHSGAVVTLTIHPASSDTGILFQRVDLPNSPIVPASAANVSETRLGTTIRTQHASVSTIEHLMASLWGVGVDNALITLNGAEVPIMDGSSEPFVEMLQMVGLKEQHAPRRLIKIKEAIRVESGESSVEIVPLATASQGFELDIRIAYDHPEIRSQKACYDFTECSFEDALAEARTFGFAEEVEQLKKIGLARGGSLHNAIVLDKNTVLNSEGLRSVDEFVRHKALDCVGDFFLAGYRIIGKVYAVKPGHQLNTALAQAILQHPRKWELVLAEEETTADDRRMVLPSYPLPIMPSLAIPAFA
jgi:UDP-3-O-[3-hydroxymyristoyl] N-acetylglucosamine deacetylase